MPDLRNSRTPESRHVLGLEPPGLESTREIVAVRNFRSRNLILWGLDGKITHVETVWKPEGIREAQRQMPRRRFAFPCRALCGLDLRRPHLTCLTCNIRRTFYGLTPNPHPVMETRLLAKPFGPGPRERIRYVLYKLTVEIAEYFADWG
jgi:hypothetical protein